VIKKKSYLAAYKYIYIYIHIHRERESGVEEVEAPWSFIEALCFGV